MTTERDAERERQATLAIARAEIAAMTPQARQIALSRAYAHLERNPNAKHLKQRIALLEEAERGEIARAPIVAGLPWEDDGADARWPARRLASWKKG